MKIEKKYHFYAGHRNKMAGVKCGRLHGHTYKVKCIFKFTEMKDGLTMLFSDIDKIVEYDHYFLLHEKDKLCELFELANEEYVSLPFETSAENLSIWIYNQIKKELPIIEIQLAETESSKIIYNG